MCVLLCLSTCLQTASLCVYVLYIHNRYGLSMGSRNPLVSPLWPRWGGNCRFDLLSARDSDKISSCGEQCVPIALAHRLGASLMLEAFQLTDVCWPFTPCFSRRQQRLLVLSTYGWIRFHILAPAGTSSSCE